MTMKKAIVCLAAAVAFAVVAAPAAAQSTAVGGGAILTDADWLDFGLQGGAYVGLGNVLPGLRVGGDLELYLGVDDGSFLALNGNAQYFFLLGPGLNAYGLAGIGYGRLSNGTSFTDVGLNVGAGMELPLTFGDLYGEVKLVTGDFDRLVLGVGLRFGL
jgi:hypothetical protein